MPWPAATNGAAVCLENWTRPSPLIEQLHQKSRIRLRRSGHQSVRVARTEPSAIVVTAFRSNPRHVSRVDVRAQCHDAWVEVQVSDSGIGIAPSFLPPVFDRYRQSGAGPGAERTGLGLGRAMSRSWWTCMAARSPLRAPEKTAARPSASRFRLPPPR